MFWKTENVHDVGAPLAKLPRLGNHRLSHNYVYFFLSSLFLRPTTHKLMKPGTQTVGVVKACSVEMSMQVNRGCPF